MYKTLRAGHANPLPLEQTFRARLIRTALITEFLAVLHFADHVIRGQLVLDRGLDPVWNHSGWPFQATVSPFTASLVLVHLLLLGGILLTLQGRVWAGYWLATALVLGALVLYTHFLSGPEAELPSVIYATYGDPVAGGLALLVLLGVLVVLCVLAIQAVWVGYRSGRW